MFFTLTLTALIYPLVKSSEGFLHMEAFTGAHSASAETGPGICSLAGPTSHRDGIPFIFLACLNAAPADPEGTGLPTHRIEEQDTWDQSAALVQQAVLLLLHRVERRRWILSDLQGVGAGKTHSSARESRFVTV